MVRATTNTVGEFERLRKLVLYLGDVETNTDTNAFVNTIIKKSFKKKDKETGDYSEISNYDLQHVKKAILSRNFKTYELVDTDLFGVVMKNFDLWTRANLTMNVTNEGFSVVYNPNFTNVINGQLDKWRSNFDKKKEATLKREFILARQFTRDILFQKQEKDIAKNQLAELLKRKNLEDVINKSYQRFTTMLDFLGVETSKTFRMYVVADTFNNMGADLSLVEDFKEIHDSFKFEKGEINLNLFGFSFGISKFVMDENSPFEENNPASNISNLKAIAYGNSFFDESVLASTFLNAEKKTIYAHQLQTFILKFGNYILKKKERLEEHYEELVNISEWNKGFLNNNSLWNFYTKELSDKESSRLELFSFSGMGLFDSDKEGNFTKERKSVVNDLNPYDFIAYQLNLIVNKYSTLKEGVWDEASQSYKEEPLITVPYFLGSNETSNTQTFFTGKWFKGFKKDGKWSPLVKGKHSVGDGAINLAREIIDNQINRAKEFNKEFSNYFTSDILYKTLESKFEGKEDKSTVDIKFDTKAWRNAGFNKPGLIEGFHTGTLRFRKEGTSFKLDTDYLSDNNTKAPRGFLVHLNLNGFFDESGRNIIYNHLYNGLSEENFEKQIYNSIKNGLNNYLKNSFKEFGYNDKKSDNVKLINKLYTGTVENSKDYFKMRDLGFFNYDGKKGVVTTDDFRFTSNIDMALLNSLFNREMFQRILHGDPSVINKYDMLDPVKRNKGEDAQISATYTELGNDYFKVGPYTSINMVQYVEAKDKDSSYGLDRSGVTGETIDSNDAQTYESAENRLHYLWGLKKLDGQKVSILDKIISGRKLTNKEIRNILDNKVVLNIEKSRIFDQQNDLKTSQTMLYKTFTSEQSKVNIFDINVFDHIKVIPTMGGKSYRVEPIIGSNKEITVEFDIQKYGSFEQAYVNNDVEVFEFIPISIELDNKRKILEGWRFINNEWTYTGEKVNIMSPISAHKRLKQDVWDENIENFKPYNIHQVSTLNYGRQVENPPKQKITDPTQQLEILPSNLPDNVTLFDSSTGELVSISKDNVIEEYFGLLASRDKESVELAINMIYDEVKDEINYEDLYAVIRDSLIETGGDIQMVELFMTSEGKPLYNGNLPSIKVKLQQHVFSYLSKDVLSHKIPGDALALQSPRGQMFLKKLKKEKVGEIEFYTWEVVPRSDSSYVDKLKAANKISTGLTYNGFTLLNNSEKSFNTLNDTLAELWNEDGDVYFLDQLRHLKPRVINGVIENYYDEATISQRDSRMNTPSEEYRYIQGVRIPSQDRATSANLEIVDFMDAFSFNSIITTQEIQELAGFGFDMNKLFIQFYEGYIKNYAFLKYKNTFEDYLYYIFSKSKLLRKILKNEIYKNEIYKYLNLEILKLKSNLNQKRISNFEIKLNEIDSIKKFLINNILKPKILNKYKLPSTEQEFNFKYKDTPFKAVANNRMLDLKKSLLIQDYKFYSTPTDVGYIKNLMDENPLDIKSDIDFNKVSFIPLNSPIFDLYYKLRAVAGKVGIGSTVTSNLTWLFLERANVYLNDNYQVKLKVEEDVKLFDKFEKQVQQIKNEEQRFVSENNSTIITASTDEAKEGVLAKYNMIGDLLSVFTEGQTLGIHPQILILAINNEQVQELAKMSLRNPLRLKKASSLQSLILTELGDYKWENSILDIADLESSKLESKDILSFVYKMLSLKEQNKDLATLIKLKRGFGATNNDYINILSSINNLGIVTPLLYEKLPNGYSVKMFTKDKHEVYNIPYTDSGFRQIHNQIRNVLPEVDKVTKKIFLENNSNFKIIRNYIKSEVNPPMYLTEEFEVALNEALLGTMISRLGKDGLAEKLGIDLLMGEDSLAKQLIKLVQEDPSLVQHSLFKTLVPVLGFDKAIKRLKKYAKNKNKTIEELTEEALKKLNIDEVKLNLFSKLNPENQTALIDDVAYMGSLFNTEKKNLSDFARNMFYYTILKDGLKYSPIGLSKIFPTYKFEPISELYNDFMSKEFTHEELINFSKETLDRFVRDINNIDLISNYTFNNAEDILITGKEERFNTKVIKQLSNSVFVFNTLNRDQIPNLRYVKNGNYIFYKVGTEEKMNNNKAYYSTYYFQLPLLGLKGYKASISNKNIASSTESYNSILNEFNILLNGRYPIKNERIKEKMRTFFKIFDNIMVFENCEIKNKNFSKDIIELI